MKSNIRAFAGFGLFMNSHFTAGFGQEEVESGECRDLSCQRDYDLKMTKMWISSILSIAHREKSLFEYSEGKCKLPNLDHLV